MIHPRFAPRGRGLCSLRPARVPYLCSGFALTGCAYSLTTISVRYSMLLPLTLRSNPCGPVPPFFFCSCCSCFPSSPGRRSSPSRYSPALSPPVLASMYLSGANPLYTHQNRAAPARSVNNSPRRRRRQARARTRAALCRLDVAKSYVPSTLMQGCAITSLLRVETHQIRRSQDLCALSISSSRPSDHHRIA